MKIKNSVWLAMVFIVACSSCKKSTTPATTTVNTLDSGLVAYYAFSGSAIDSTSNHNNGTVNGATLVADRKGNAGKAYYFNGVNNSILIPYSSSLDLKSDFSISVWINPDYNTLSAGSNAFILYHGDSKSGYDPFFLCYNVANANPLLGLDPGDGTTANLLQPASSVNFKNVWTHVVGTWNNTNKSMQLFVNGASVAQNSYPSSLPISYTTNTAGFVTYVGCVDGSLTFYKGIIDELRIYKRVLTNSEVFSLSNQ